MPKYTLLLSHAWGAKSLRDYGTFQVLEIDGRVELAGQGRRSPDTLDVPAGIAREAEIDQAFDNVATLLSHVGRGWADVVHVDRSAYRRRTA